MEMFVIIDLKRCIVASTLFAAFVTADAHRAFSQHHAVLPSVSV
jgi:hypothetical protein